MKLNYFEKILRESIDKDIKIESQKEVLKEAYVAQQKNFNILTDYLSSDSVSNHKELYKDYLENYNQISAKLDTADRSNLNSSHSDFRNLKNDETYNMNATYLHELYFANIGDNNSQISMDTLSYMRLSRDFGTFDAWQKDFIACAQSSQSGWAITYLNTFTHSYMNCFIDLHSQNVPVGMHPIIVVDMWQHAYYKDYLRDSKTYLLAMMKQLDWVIIEKRIIKADKIIEALRGV
jgi:superoxide dismutase, Fe-Mn family